MALEAAADEEEQLLLGGAAPSAPGTIAVDSPSGRASKEPAAAGSAAAAASPPVAPAGKGLGSASENAGADAGAGADANADADTIDEEEERALLGEPLSAPATLTTQPPPHAMLNGSGSRARSSAAAASASGGPGGASSSPHRTATPPSATSFANKPSKLFFTQRRQEDPERVIHLPRGGTLVLTAAGPVQFGIPPESIKDCMSMGLEIPMYYVVPTERFNRKIGHNAGINVAEFEFPAYWNFFFKRRKLVLLVDSDDVRKRVLRVFRETLLGPEQFDPEADFSPEYPRDKIPAFDKELAYFTKFGDAQITLDAVLGFLLFGEQNDILIPVGERSGNTGVGQAPTHVRVRQSDQSTYIVEEGVLARPSDPSSFTGDFVAEVAAEVKLPMPNLPRSRSRRNKVFAPPLFGVTVLGNSHGFDPKGSTTGYILWVNRRGIMVDPPPNSSVLLQLSNIPPCLIDGVILTHCHADVSFRSLCGHCGD